MGKKVSVPLRGKTKGKIISMSRYTANRGSFISDKSNDIIIHSFIRIPL